MKFIKVYFFVLNIFFVLNSNAGSIVDSYNTYRFNRSNHMSHNKKIDRRPWFEWWYYKVIDPSSGESFFFVYGVVNPWDVNKTLDGSRSYLGMGDFKSMTQVETLYGVEDFKASYKKTQVLLPDGSAYADHFNGKIVKNNKVYEWDIKISKKWSFNAVGFLTGSQLTNIEWYPAQADARCSGVIYSNNKKIVLDNAPCYQDRNWGHSFPKWWTWIVSNYFENSRGTALVVGGGRPVILNHFPIEGVAIGFRYNGKVYTFRPNNFDKIIMNISFGTWEVVGISVNYKIVISANDNKDKFMDLKFMSPLGKIFHDYETLTGKLSVKLYKRQYIMLPKWKQIANVKSNYSGIEFGSWNNLNYLFK